MPTRRLPKTNQEILNALQAAFDHSELFTDKTKLAFTHAVYLRLVAFLSNFITQITQEGSALAHQTEATGAKSAAFDLAVMYISHFFQGLNNAIARGIFPASVRAYYHIDVNDSRVPSIKSETDLTQWNRNIKEGEAARVADGGTLVPWPTAAEVDAHYRAYFGHSQEQSGFKETYIKEHGDVTALILEAKAIVRDIWDDVENTFRHDEPGLLRTKAEEWGVIYENDEQPEPGEEPTVFSGIVAPATSVVAMEGGFDANTEILCTNIGPVPLKLFTSKSGTDLPPATTVEVASGEQKAVFISDLGAADNTFLMVFNESETTEGSYEVEVGE
jgi:hypothetical protein